MKNPFSDNCLLGSYKSLGLFVNGVKSDIILKFHRKNWKLADFGVYALQSGGQGAIFSLFDKLYKKPLMEKGKIREHSIFKMTTALFLALVLAWWLIWVNAQFGLFISLFALSSILFNWWLIIMGTNLFYMFAFIFLPMVSIFWAFKKKVRQVDLIAFITLLISFLISGFKFLPVTIGMAFVPLAFYGIKVDGILHILRGVILAFLVAITILICQISSAKKINLYRAGSYLAQNIVIRTYEESFNFKYINKVNSDIHTPHNTNSLISKQLAIVRFNIWGLKIKLWQFISAVAMASIFIRNRLTLATWFSILCPLSWILLMRGQVAIHQGVDSIVWDMPFTLMGCLLIGTAVRKLTIGE
jgi:hypothetical protein